MCVVSNFILFTIFVCFVFVYSIYNSLDQSAETREVTFNAEVYSPNGRLVESNEVIQHIEIPFTTDVRIYINLHYT